jgi:hypothetical protein
VQVPNLVVREPAAEDDEETCREEGQPEGDEALRDVLPSKSARSIT